MPPDYRLIVITAPDVPPRQLVEACRAAASGGATAVQVRAKGASASQLLRITDEVIGAIHIPVYVNDRVDVARASGAHGVHLGAEDLPLERAHAALSASLALGLSVGSEAEAEAARRAGADYWSLGPFYGTQTKSDVGAPLGQAGFRRLRALAPSGMPVIAIGGIDHGNLPGVLEAGAAGVAVIGAVFGADDVERATRRMRKLLDEALD
ncbi:MAG: thiamine phosphate synthase [Gemmatimonadetes bacterium]|nr:thiamine phosphate synthase [Gemmatimonadota bacterium]